MRSSTTYNNPKPCNYNCGTRIYWNTSENAYFEVFSGNKHQCPNRSSSTNKNSLMHNSGVQNKPNYYKKPFYSTNEPKPKMSNSLELLTGPIDIIQSKYEILSNIVINECNGKVHGSQSHINGNSISLVVYFEIPEGQRETVKHNFSNYIKN